MSHDVCPECCQAMVHLGAASAGLTEIFHGFPTSDSDSAFLVRTAGPDEEEFLVVDMSRRSTVFVHNLNNRIRPIRARDHFRRGNGDMLMMFLVTSRAFRS